MGRWDFALQNPPEFNNSGTITGYPKASFQPPVLELNMLSSLHHNVRMMRVLDQELAGLATICVGCFLSVLPCASAQSKPKPNFTHSKSSAQFKSTPHVHSLEQKPQSVPSSVVPEVIGKPSGRAGMSPEKELDQLERAGSVKPTTGKRVAPPAATKSTLPPEKHSAPINFTHKELPQSPHSRAPKTH